MDEIIKERLTSSDVRNIYTVRYRTLREWVRRRRNKSNLQMKGGRPRCLDGESMKALRSLVNETPNIDPWEFREEIRREHKKSYERSTIYTGKCCKYKVMPRSTLLRYIVMFLG